MSGMCMFVWRRLLQNSVQLTRHGASRNHVPLVSAKLVSSNVSIKHVPAVRWYTNDVEQQKEHEFAHGLLEKIVSYQTKLVTASEQETASNLLDLSTILDRVDVEQASLEDLISTVERLSNMDTTLKLVAMENPQVFAITDRVISLLPSASDTQLKELMALYSRLNVRANKVQFKRQLSRLAISLKNELDVRADDWSLDTILYYMDFFNQTNRKVLTSTFMERFVDKMDALTKEQVILLLHNLSVSYSSHHCRDLLLTLEGELERQFDACSMQELAVAALGFFRSRYVLQSESLVEKFATRLRSEIGVLDERTVVAVIKIINYSTRNGTAYSNSSVRESMRAVTQALLPQLRDFSPSSCTNLFRISASLHQLNHNLMDALCQKLIHADIKHWRLKDLAWFTFTFGQFQCMLDEKQWFYGKIIRSLESLERRAEILQYPNALVQSLIGLSMVGIYPNSLLNEVLSSTFRARMRGKYLLNRFIIVVPNSRIMSPPYLPLFTCLFRFPNIRLLNTSITV